MKKAKKTVKAAKKTTKKTVAKKAAPKKSAKKAAAKKPAVKKAAAKKKPAVKKAAAKKKPAVKKAVAKKKPAAPKKPVAKKRVARKPKPTQITNPIKRSAASKATKKTPKIRLTPKTKEQFISMLVAMRQRLTGQIAALQGDSLKRLDAGNSEEDGSDAFERQFALNLASTENDVVFEIDEALQRIEHKTYGVCEQCSNGIESARLKALPFVRMCIGCKTEIEKGTRRFKPTL